MTERKKKKPEKEPKTVKFLSGLPAGRQVSIRQLADHLPGGRRVMWAGLVLAGVIGIFGLFVYLRRPKAPQISNFQECLQAGYPILESYPRQCRTQKGEIFVEEIPIGEGPAPEEACVDLCGDGICQEVVCMGVGCPCPETPESCPEDCASDH